MIVMRRQSEESPLDCRRYRARVTTTGLFESYAAGIAVYLVLRATT